MMAQMQRRDFIRLTQGPCGGTLCRDRPAHDRQPDSHQRQALGARLPTMHAFREYVESGV